MSHRYFTRDLGIEAMRRSPLPGYNLRGSRQGMTVEEIDLVSNYARWLHNREFLLERNKACAAVGLPGHKIPVFIRKDRAKPLYDGLLREIVRETGTVPLKGGGELRAVLDALMRRRAEVTR